MQSSFSKSSGMDRLNYSLGNSSLRYFRNSGMMKSDEINTDIHDYLKSGMGEQRYKMLKKSESMTLQHIYIRRTALRGTGQVEKKGIVNHDRVVVELFDVQECTLYHICAEKMMDESGRRDHGEQVPSGIVIEWMPKFSFDKNLDVKYDCFGSAINFKEVVKVLKTPSPKYHLIEANCWQYAASVTCNLIEKLVENVASSSAEVRAKLQSVLNAAQQHLDHTMTVIPGSAGKTILAIAGLAAAIGAIGAIFILGSLFSGHSEHDEEE